MEWIFLISAICYPFTRVRWWQSLFREFILFPSGRVKGKLAVTTYLGGSKFEGSDNATMKTARHARIKVRGAIKYKRAFVLF